MRPLAALLLAAVAVLAAAACMTAARAQSVDETLAPLADLSLSAVNGESRSAIYWTITVESSRVGRHPLARMHNVQVRFSVETLSPGEQVAGITFNPQIRLRSTYPIKPAHGRYDRSSLTWTIPELPVPGDGPAVMHLARAPIIPPNTLSPGGEAVVRLTAEIVGSDPVEAPGFQHNNSREFFFINQKYAIGNAGVSVSDISDRSPAAGGTTTVTVQARNYASSIQSTPSFPIAKSDGVNAAQFGVQVKIELSPGLTFAGTPTGPSGTSFSKTNSTSGIWDIGDLEKGRANAKLLPVAVNLSSATLEELPLDQRCLTAEVISAVPWFADDPTKRENDIAVACLVESPPLVLTGGTITLFEFYPCVGVATPPCTSAGGLELVAGIPGTSLQPDAFVLHIDDIRGRNTLGGKTIWSTEHIFDLKDSQTRLPETAWSSAREDLTVTGAGGGSLPGSFTVRFVASSQIDPIAVTGTTKVVGDSFDPGYDVEIYLDFSSLGTYVLTLDIRATHTSSTTPFTDSGTYTFHIGPRAELEVRDAGASPAVAADQRAYTVTALNHGPDAAPDVRVSGLPTGVTEYVVSHGSYDSANGVWMIGELRVGDYRAYGFATEGPTLTLITDDSVGATAMASIEDMGTYCVRIKHQENDLPCNGNLETGYTQHSADYYDHIQHNNSATITARAGTGAGAPGTPEGLTVLATAVGNVMHWEALARLNGVDVTHYEVQRQTAVSWETLSSSAASALYWHSAGGGGATYRVRAVNIFGVGGPWSEPASPQNKPGKPTGFTATGQSDTAAALSWTAPAVMTGVTGYDIAFSQDLGETWTALATVVQSATTYSHSDSNLASDTASLTPEIKRQYRVRTVATVNGATDRSDWVAVMLTYERPAAPTGFSAAGVNPTDATLEWTAPTGVSDIRGYDLEFSKDGGVSWSALTGTQTLSGTTWTYPHTDENLGANHGRLYRVRTVIEVGSVRVTSVWVLVRAQENYAAPGAPKNFAAAAVSDSLVNLTWSAPDAVDGVTHSGYELGVSFDRGVTWTDLAGTSTLGASAVTHPHNDAANPLSSKPRQYRLRSVGDASGTTFKSGWVFAVPAEEVGPPRDLAASADGIGRIDLSWNLPAVGADRVTGYRIDRAEGADGDWQTREHGWRASPRTYEDTGLDPGQLYCYRVAAIFAAGVGPFAARACAATEGAPADLPGQPENLRIAQTGSNFVRLEWDPPSVGGAVDYYDYRSNLHGATPVAATSVRVGGLTPGQIYDFQVRGVNSYGEGEWSDGIQVTLNRSGGAIRVSTQELQVSAGGSTSFNVRLTRASRWPLMVYFHSIGPACLTDQLAYQQHQILLPSSPQPNRAFWADGWFGAAPSWSVGVTIEIDASGCRGGETTVIEPIFNTVPFSQIEGAPMWDELGLNQDDWRQRWGLDPLEGTSGPSIKVTVVGN